MDATLRFLVSNFENQTQCVGRILCRKNRKTVLIRKSTGLLKSGMRYFIYFAYNGSAYRGWQIQPNGISVQEVFTNSLRVILREETVITAAGRTDAGVHAKKMVAHFDAERTDLDTAEFIRQLNSILPKDIAVQKIVP